MNLKELSRQLNLSPTTVSRALNGYPEVKEATRLRVAEAARQSGYQPNVRARTLATGRSMSIGHIIPASRQNEIANVIFADFIAGAAAVYAANGYTMALMIVGDEDELSAYRGVSDRGAVDGVLVQSPTRQDPRIAHLSALDIPFIVHGRASDVTAPYAWLDVNNTRAIEVATRHLTEQGHRRIALINGEERMDFALRRREGYLAALASAALTADEHLMIADEMSEPVGYTAAMDLLGGTNPPSAFVASSIVSAMGIHRAIGDRDLVMGRDVSVVCYDDDISYFPNHGKPPVFTAVKSSVRSAGARCAQLLIDLIRAPGTSLPGELWDVELVFGKSTGPVSR